VSLTTSDLGKVVLRGAIAGPMLYAGRKHATSQAGTSRWLKSMGFGQPELNAKIMAISELGAGASLLTGTLTTAGCATTIGVMTVAIRTLHAKNGYSIEKEGYEFTLSLAMASAALAVLGPGRLSGDRILGLHETLAGALGALAAAAAVPIAFGHLAALWHKPEPAPVAPATPEADGAAAVGGTPEVAQA
jgi:putative oxidoreductase